MGVGVLYNRTAVQLKRIIVVITAFIAGRVGGFVSRFVTTDDLQRLRLGRLRATRVDGTVPLFPAIVSRRFSWRLMLLGALVGLIVGPLVMGLRQYPWAAVPFVALAVIVIHPVMNREVPSLIGIDMLRSPRTYIAVALLVVAELIAEPYSKAFRDRILAG